MDEKELRNLARLAKYAIRQTGIKPYVVTFTSSGVDLQGKFDSKIINRAEKFDRGFSGGYVYLVRNNSYRIRIILTE